MTVFVTWFGITEVVMSVMRSVYLLFFTLLHVATLSVFFPQNFNYCQLQWDARPDVTQPVAHQLYSVSGQPPVHSNKTESGLKEVLWMFLCTACKHKLVSLTASILLPCFSLNKFPCVCLYVAFVEDQTNKRTD